MTSQGSGGSGQEASPDDPTRVDLEALGNLGAPPPQSSPLAAEPMLAGTPPPPPGQGPPPIGQQPPAPAPLPPPWGPAPVATAAWAPAPAAGRYAVPGAPGLEYSGALPRFVAYLIDSFMLGIVSLVISGIVGSAAPGSSVAAFAGGLLGLLVDAAYFVLLWTSDGRATVGMRLLKLQIGNAVDGRVISPEQAVRRWLAYGLWVPSVVVFPGLAALASFAWFVWVLVLLGSIATSPTHQGLHDRFAETAIVQPAGGAANAVVMGCLAIVVIIVVVVFGSIVALIFLGSQVSSILSNVGTSV
jgi:uncharacterized RDD family membrane protein YckC